MSVWKWSDKKSYDCYNNLRSYIKKNKSYALKCSEDDLIIDCIVENNFRYLACIDLYLPNSKVILQPTCHSELFIYAEDYNKILPVLKEVTYNSELVLSKNAFDWKWGRSMKKSFNILLRFPKLNFTINSKSILLLIAVLLHTIMDMNFTVITLKILLI